MFSKTIKPVCMLVLTLLSTEAAIATQANTELVSGSVEPAAAGMILASLLTLFLGRRDDKHNS